MAGSSIKNSLHRRNHKERSQLVGRQRLGLLEKHKDYVLRARDYASKKQRIKRLQEKVAERNKDEFYFGMVNSKTQAGIAYQSRGNVALDMDVVKLLKSQDANYVRTQLAIERSQAERTKAQLQQLTDLLPEASSSSSARSPAVPIEEDSDDEDAALERNLRKAEAETLAASGLLGPAAKGKGKAAAGRPARKPKKTVFVDSRAELDAYQPSASTSSNAVASSSTSAAPADAPPVDLGWASPPKSMKARKADAAAALAASSSSSAAPTAAALAAEAEADRVRKSKKHRLHLLHSLSSHLTRAAHLAEAQKEMELQKLLMGKGGKKKLASLKPEEESDPEEEFDEDNPQKRRREGFSGRAFKWAAERKR